MERKKLVAPPNFVLSLIPEMTRKLTTERFETILKAVEDGLTITSACKTAKIGRSTFYRELDADRDKWDALKKAQAQRDVMITDEAIQAIHAAFSKDWKAAAWWLERNHPGLYSLRNDLRPQEPEKHVTTEEEWKEMLRDSPELRRHLRGMIDKAEVDGRQAA